MTAEPRTEKRVDDRTGAAPAPDGPVSKIDYSERIPNNVNLNGDRRLQRALEGWQPKFLDWWKTLGPSLPTKDVYLRTAIAVGRDGWAHFDHVPMEEYRWGIFLAEADPDRKVNFGDKKGEPAWQEVPGEHRSDLRRLIVVQGDTEPASVEQQRHLGMTAPSLYDMRNLFQVNVEEGRHPWQHVLARGGRRRHDGLIIPGQRHDQGRDRLGELVRIGRCVGQQHLLDAVELRRRVGRGLRIGAGHQHMHRCAKGLGGGERLVGGVLEMSVIVLGDQQSGHSFDPSQSTPASVLSFWTSSATEPTFTPALRPPGSAVLSTFRRGAMSTPSVSGLVSSRGFFLAFMMFGRLA